MVCDFLHMLSTVKWFDLSLNTSKLIKRLTYRKLVSECTIINFIPHETPVLRLTKKSMINRRINRQWPPKYLLWNEVFENYVWAHWICLEREKFNTSLKFWTHKRYLDTHITRIFIHFHNREKNESVTFQNNKFSSK